MNKSQISTIYKFLVKIKDPNYEDILKSIEDSFEDPDVDEEKLRAIHELIIAGSSIEEIVELIGTGANKVEENEKKDIDVKAFLDSKEQQKKNKLEEMKEIARFSNPNLFISAYQILGEFHTTNLQNAVNKEMKNGWYPFGGVATARTGNLGDTTARYFQALVKYK